MTKFAATDLTEYQRAIDKAARELASLEQECRDRECTEADVRARLADAENALARVRDIHRDFGLYEPCQNEVAGCEHGYCVESPATGEFYHEDRPTGRACAECHDEDGDHVEWPCDTIAELDGTS